MNRVVVISGASSGIGEALAKLFIAAGDKVYGLDKAKPEVVEHHFLCDITKDDEVKHTVHKIMQFEESIDILINNAGVGISGACELLPTDKVREVLEVNVNGTFYLTKYCLPFMKGGAKIVNISSVTAFFPTPFRTVYCMAKSAVSMFTNGLRMELSESGIQATAICPAETKTNFTKNRIKEFDTNERYGNRILNAAQGIDAKDGQRMPVDFVADKIYKKISKKKLKPYYIIGGKFKALNFITRFVPLNTLLKVTNKHFGGFKNK